jgi:hypothetical protein
MTNQKLHLKTDKKNHHGHARYVQNNMSKMIR